MGKFFSKRINKKVIRELLLSKKAFSLIELMVVVSIMVILSTISISGMLASRSRNAVDIVTNQIVTDIRRAQSKALDGEIILEGIQGHTNKKAPPCVYGVEFKRDFGAVSDTFRGHEIIALSQKDLGGNSGIPCEKPIMPALYTGDQCEYKDIDAHVKVILKSGDKYYVWFKTPMGQRVEENSVSGKYQNVGSSKTVLEVSSRDPRINTVKTVTIMPNGAVLVD